MSAHRAHWMRVNQHVNPIGRPQEIVYKSLAPYFQTEKKLCCPSKIVSVVDRLPFHQIIQTFQQKVLGKLHRFTLYITISRNAHLLNDGHPVNHSPKYLLWPALVLAKHREKFDTIFGNTNTHHIKPPPRTLTYAPFCLYKIHIIWFASAAKMPSQVIWKSVGKYTF